MSRSNGRKGWDWSFFLPVTVWDDEKFPFTGVQLDSPAGRIDYDYAELGAGFQNNAIYPTDLLVAIEQFPHKWKFESQIHPQLHWIQNQNQVPNWLLEYRIYRNGDAIPAVWTQAIAAAGIFPYTAGSILQISPFPLIDMSGIDSVSAIMDIKFYRDTSNVSTLFAGADPYTGTALAKEFDIHIQINSNGSRLEFIK